MTSKRRLLLSLVSTTLVLYLAVGPLVTRVLGSDSGYAQLSIFHEVLSMVRDSYVDPVNLDRTIAAAENGLLEALDGDSALLDEAAFSEWTSRRKALASVGLVLGRRFGFLTVVASEPSSPARRAGLKPGDFIKTIDGRHSHSLSVITGERLLEGEPGSIVKIAIFKLGGDTNDVELVRERVSSSRSPVTAARLLDGGVGYLALGAVPEPAVIKDAVQSLARQGARSLVLDLRGTASGPITSGPKAAELFVPAGRVAKLVSRNSAELAIESNGAARIWAGPLVALVDRGTAGAAEVVAAALLANGNRLVGENTFGRAGVQKAIPLASGGGLILTVSRYAAPNGDAIHGRGVAPSVAVKNPETLEDFGDPTKDRVLGQGLDILKGA